MRGEYGGTTRRRKTSHRVAPLSRSQSLNAVTASLSSGTLDQLSLAGGDSDEKVGAGANFQAAHLPPLGRKDGRLPLRPALQPQPRKGRTLLRASRWGDADSSPTCPETTSCPGAGPGWVSTTDIFVRGGEAAGIALKWTEVTPAIAGLSVVSIADGSAAAKNSHVVSGMFLVEINQRRVTGIDHDEIMRVMQAAASHPRVLTLARMGSSRPLPTTRCTRNSKAEALPGNTTSGCAKEPPTPDTLSATSTSVAVDAASRWTTPSCSLRQPMPRATLARSSSHSALSSSDSDSWSVGGSVVSFATPLRPVMSSERPGTEITPRSRVQQEYVLPLRFVGSRGDPSLYDRDHILGLKRRNIEFLTNSASASRSSRANSRKSLGELAIDWRNDPCSTPARRRRLIHDVCKVVVGSYVHASAARVAKLRIQQTSVTHIQAAARMWATRRRFVAHIVECRARAALCLQLGWLSYVARRSVSFLRKERDHARRIDKAKRKIRLPREEAERHQREEERRRVERQAQEEERRRHKHELVVFVQRRFRALKEHRKAMEVQRLRDQQREIVIQKAASTIQEAFRRHGKANRLRELSSETFRDIARGAAISCLQRAWRRCRRPRNERASFTPLSNPPAEETLSPAAQTNVAHALTIAAMSTGRSVNQPNLMRVGNNFAAPSNPRSQPGQQQLLEGEGLSNNRGNWTIVNPPLATEIAREDLFRMVARGAAVDEEDYRSSTVAGAKEPTTSQETPITHPPPPPADMMTVRVRIGSEETSLVTPIVVAEVSKNTPSDPEENNTITADEIGTHHLLGAAQSGLVGARASIVSAQRTALVVSAGIAQPILFRAEGPMLRRAVEEQGTDVTQRMDCVSTPQYSFGKGQGRADRDDITNSVLPLPPSAIPGHGSGSGTKPLAASIVISATKLNEERPTSDAAKNVARGTEQFMEDSQVYLGCAICGVKYLVEAVDPRLPKSTKGQPTPEVLYLCTTCGGTLRNGEDGRWRRRRRPNSAPAAGRRVKDAFSEAEKNWTLGGQGAGEATWTASRDDEDENMAQVNGHREERVAKLRYACCARTIQRAYYDFQHRQYLRDWAFSLLRRWLVGRVQAHRRSRHRLRRRHAAVTVQSAARAVYARRRCSRLRATRLRRWVDMAAERYRDADDSFPPPSPLGAELLREVRAPSPTTQKTKSSSPQRSSSAPADGCKETECFMGEHADRRGRELAEALAPRMGRAPPGCPGALDVDWGEWGTKLTLKFPPPDAVAAVEV